MTIGYLAAKLTSGVNWTIIIPAAMFTEGAKQEIMFFLGAAAAIVTIASKLYEMYNKHKENKKQPENKL